jgi:hypothetical protein
MPSRSDKARSSKTSFMRRAYSARSRERSTLSRTRCSAQRQRSGAPQSRDPSCTCPQRWVPVLQRGPAHRAAPGTRKILLDISRNIVHITPTPFNEGRQPVTPVDGAGCGACGCAFVAHAIGTLRVGRPAPLRGSAGSPAGRWPGRTRAKACGIGMGEAHPARSGRTAPERKIAEQSSLRRLRKLVCDVERREAGGLRTGRAPWKRRDQTGALRRSTPSLGEDFGGNRWT